MVVYSSAAWTANAIVPICRGRVRDRTNVMAVGTTTVQVKFNEFVDSSSIVENSQPRRSREEMIGVASGDETVA
ncbi:MAG TPA: hypothetical protein VF980_06135 [Thermoanaerobaculia bacterium]